MNAYSLIIHANYVQGEQAKKYFLKSNLPPMVLGQIW